MNRWLSLFHRSDKYLLGTTLLLVCVGLLMIYSTTLSGPSRASLLTRQIVAAILGFGLLLLCSRIDYRWWKVGALAIYLVGVALLAGVLVFGKVAGGSVRWFSLGPYQFQPVEFMKLASIIYGAAFVQAYGFPLDRLRYFLLFVLVGATPVMLTLRQPDLGSSLVLAGIWFAQLLLGGARKAYVIALLLISVIVGLVAWTFVLRDYQKSRVESFLNPGRDPQGQGYNALQAITAVGAGGVLGQGYARGVVSQLRYLPEPQTDFIFASFAEELGLVGGVFLLTLLVVWQVRMIRIVARAGENFGVVLAFGIFLSFSLQSWINIGMNIGLLPITGVPLPLVSYGGSSLLMSLASLGMLQSVSIHTRFPAMTDPVLP